MARFTTEWCIKKIVDKTEGKGNPATAGNWRLQIQVADGARQITVPFTKVNTSSRGAIRVKPRESDYGGNNIYDTFDLRQNASREQRQIFTGNVIRAFSNFKGKLVNYKDYQGNVRQGLLMRKGFEIEKELAKAPVKMPAASQALAFLSIATRHELKTSDQNLTVKRYGNGDLVLTTPRPKDIGGRYYHNPVLLEAAQNEFYSLGNQMAMTVSAERAADVLNALYQQDYGLSAYSELDGARQFLGVEIPKLEELTDEMLASMAPPLEVGDPVVAASHLERMFDLPAVTPEELASDGVEPMVEPEPTALTAADYEQTIADTLGQNFFVASGIDLETLVDQPNFAIALPAVGDGAPLSAFLTDGVLTLEQTLGVGASIAFQFSMLDDGINLTETFINGSRQYEPGAAILRLSDWIEQGYPQLLAVELQAMRAAEQVQVIEILTTAAPETYYLLPNLQAIAVGPFASIDLALDYAVDQSLDLALEADPLGNPPGVATADRVETLGLEIVSPERFLTAMNAIAVKKRHKQRLNSWRWLVSLKTWRSRSGKIFAWSLKRRRTHIR